MKIASIQEVKAEVLHSLAATNKRSTIGLGRAKRGQENILAVRFYDRLTYWKNKLNWFNFLTHGEVDVRFVGKVFAGAPEQTWQQGRVRPLKIGSSVSHGRVTAGTLGCFVKNTDNSVCLLSNNHVIANQNNAVVGDKICQPGTHDGGSLANDSIAELSQFIEIKERNNLVDAAVAKIDRSEQVESDVLSDIGYLHGFYEEEVEPGDLVAKFGRTTGVTLGRVTAVEVDNVGIGYSDGAKYFDSQIEIEGAENGPFSRGGDSGSMVVMAPEGRGTKKYQAMGLLFAGGTQGGTNGQGFTYANYMSNVLSSLNCKLYC